MSTLHYGMMFKDNFDRFQDYATAISAERQRTEKAVANVRTWRGWVANVSSTDDDVMVFRRKGWKSPRRAIVFACSGGKWNFTKEQYDRLVDLTKRICFDRVWFVDSDKPHIMFWFDYKKFIAKLPTHTIVSGECVYAQFDLSKITNVIGSNKRPPNYIPWSRSYYR